MVLVWKYIFIFFFSTFDFLTQNFLKHLLQQVGIKGSSTFGFELLLSHTPRFTQKKCHFCEIVSCNEEIVCTFYILHGKVKFLEENFYWIIFRRNIVCAEIRQSLCVGRTSFLSGNGYVFLCISVAVICFFILVIPHFLSDLLVFWWEFPAWGELTPNVLIAWILLSASPRQRQRAQKTEACSV